MKLTVAQLKVLSRLLDEALPLNVAARSAWLEALPPEHHELMPSLRAALLMEQPAAGTVESLDVLPRIDVADGPAAATAGTLVIALAVFFHGHWPRAGDADVTTPPTGVAAARPPHAAVDAVAPVLTSLVVLPFLNESESPAETYYPDALTYRLTLLLARVRKLQVTFSTAAQRFRGSGLPATAIAQQLGVQWVLVGQVHKEGSQIHVAVQLIRATDGQSLWSRAYDREVREAFQLEEGIASGVVEALDAGVLGGALPRRAVPTAPAAYDLLLRALGTWLGPEPVNRELPVEYLRRAVALDPDYADAWAALGWAYSTRRIPPGGPNIAKTRSAAAQALRLDPRNESANLLMQDLHLSYDWDWSAAEKDLGRILEADPAAELLPEAGFLDLANGHTARALPLLRQALVRDPLNRIHYNNLGILYYGAGRLEEADAAFGWLERARRLKALGMFYLDVRHDPLLARLHRDARFRLLLRELGLAEADAGS